MAYLSAFLKRRNFEVYTAKFLSDATTIVKCTRPCLAICGSTTQASSVAFEKFRQADPRMQVLLLPADFHAAEASQAGMDLLDRIQRLLSTQE